MFTHPQLSLVKSSCCGAPLWQICCHIPLSASLPKVLETLQNTSSILILEGQALQLLCAADSNPPAELSWFRGSPALNATPIYRSPILDLPQVGVLEQGDFTCRAQNSLGSQHVSLHLSVVCE